MLHAGRPFRIQSRPQYGIDTDAPVFHQISSHKILHKRLHMNLGKSKGDSLGVEGEGRWV